MKRILAMLIALVVSTFSGTKYIASDENTYFQKSYYVIEDTNVRPSYRDLYNGNCADIKELCLTSTTQAPRATLKGNNGYYWLSSTESSEGASALGDTLTCTQDGVLIAPFNCLVVTDASGSAGGTFMTLESTDGKYTITVEGMERWFCCRNRELPEDGVWQHTDKHKSKTITVKKGYIIGNHKEGTLVILSETESKTNIPWSILYN